MQGSEAREAPQVAAPAAAAGPARSGGIAGLRPLDHLAHPVLADLDTPPSAAEIARERSRAVALAAHTRRAERLWPAWLLCLALGIVYTAWCVSEANIFGVMLGMHVIVGFGLLTWTRTTAEGLRGVGRTLRREGQA